MRVVRVAGNFLIALSSSQSPCESHGTNRKLPITIITIIETANTFRPLLTSNLTRPALFSQQAILALRSLRVSQPHNPTADAPQPKRQPIRRYLVHIASRGGDPKEERFELPRTPVISRRCSACLLNDGCGQVGRIEAEAVFQPEAEELTDVREFDVFIANTLHADDRIRF